MTMNSPSYADLQRLAWPIMLANVATPLLGLVDTAVIGNTGAVADLGAIALGALIFNFLYWGFGFLRMGTTGFVAHSAGANDSAEIRAAALRGILLGAAIGLSLCALQGPISHFALQLFDGGTAVEDGAASYLHIRLWSAPASLATFAILGVLIGLAKTREVLRIQILLNGLNIPLDLLFAGVLGWGVQGVAFGTALAEWVTLGYACWRLWRLLRSDHDDDEEAFLPWPRVRNRAALIGALRANGDILIRTAMLLFCFAAFVNGSARFGDATLAANHILLQFVTISAYVLDGYAHAAEPLVGRAMGRRDAALFEITLRRSLRLAGAAAVLLAGGFFVIGDSLIMALTNLGAVQHIASGYLLFACAYIALSFAAFQLDGIFIGAGATVAMRQASLASGAVYLLMLLAVTRWEAGYAWHWSIFIAYVALRALALGGLLAKLRRNLAST